MAIQLKVIPKIKKHNLGALNIQYNKRFRETLLKIGKEGVKDIEHEIKKRNIKETEDLVSFELTQNYGIKFTCNYPEKTSESKVPEKLGEDPESKLLEEVPPEAIGKILDTGSQKSIEQGFKNGIKKIRENLISEFRKLNKEIIANV